MVRRRSKPLADLDLAKSISKDVTPRPSDGLPPYKRFFFSAHKHLKLKIWLGVPSAEEKESAKKRKGISAYRNISIHDPIVLQMHNKGFSREFAEGLARLFIHRYEHREITPAGVRIAMRSLKAFIGVVRLHYDGGVAKLSLDDISLEMLLLYRDHLSALRHIETTKSGMFVALKQLFSHESLENHRAISMLKYIRSKGDKKKPAKDLTAPLANTTRYCDAVMFQLFSHYIVDFERHIKLLKEYETLTRQTVQDLCGGMVAILPSTTSNPIKTGKENSVLIKSWLEDEAYYPFLVEHELWWWKEWEKDFYYTQVRWDCDKPEHLRPLVVKYNEWVNDNYGIPSFKSDRDRKQFRTSIKGIVCKDLLNKKGNHGVNVKGVKHRTGHCLVNILMITTGLNREVILSWPSTVNGVSILDQEGALFSDLDDGESQVMITGIKSRAAKKEITTAISKKSPLYRMMKEYRDWIKGDHENNFFEFSKTFAVDWKFMDQFNGNRNLFPLMYPIRDEKGNFLQSLEATKFRKVFGKKALFDLVENVSNPIELAEKISDSFQHGQLDTTICNYLLKEDDARNVIDLAIVTITGSKLEELRFAGKIHINNNYKHKKEVFLCDCEDPFNPSHGVKIAQECFKYDLCLGCHRSQVSQKHLPYICARILQYEALKENPIQWSRLYEDQWLIAHDALKRYEIMDKKSGRQLVSEAWQLARKKKITLPPIIMQGI